MPQDFLVSADGHIVEPPDLYVTRVPKHLRSLAMWEEDFDVEPIGDDGYTRFSKLHTPGYEGWAYSRYIHQDGTPNLGGDPDKIIADMDSEGIYAQLMHPNLSLQTLYTDHHELSFAHAQVYNDFVAETFSAYRERLFPTAPIPLTDIDDAVAEIERVAGLGFRTILVPSEPPVPYYSRDLDRVWAAANAHRMLVASHVATGGVKVADKVAATMKGLKDTVDSQNQPLTEKSISDRMIGAAAYAPIVPQTMIASLIGGGVLERFPDLHFLLIEFNANWLAAAMAAMDKAWTTGIGQNRDWWVGYWDDSLAPNEQAGMAQVFRLNDRYPYSLMPSEFVQRQIHVSFQEDPVAVANRQVTGVQTLLWGADYPHAEGTFGRSREAIAAQFDGVGSDDRAAILGGTLGGLLGVKAPAKA